MTRTAHLTADRATATGRHTIQPRRRLRASSPLELDDVARRREAERLAGALAGWYAETLAGRRDVRQLRELLTPTVEHRVLGAVLRERARLRLGARRTPASVTVRRVIMQAVSDRYEAVVVIDDGVRCTAVTAVLHPGAAGWIVSELARPEDHVPALAPPVLR
ncbi:MAG: hypothetical protein ACI9AD_000967 [Nitriliruptoraceae bacterium]